MRIWKLREKIGLLVAGLLALEVIKRVITPGINGQVLQEYFRHGGGSVLISLYDTVAGGALTTGGVLALGIVPYLAAKLWIRIARVALPSVNRLFVTETGRAKLTNLARVLTVGFSVVQSYGLVQFLNGIPGVVTVPGLAFTARTMLILTGVSVATMAFSEYVARVLTDHTDSPDFEHDATLDVASPPDVARLSTPAVAFDGAPARDTQVRESNTTNIQ